MKKYLTRRTIVIGGPLLSDDISDSALSALLKECVSSFKRQSIFIETRNLNDYSQWKNVFADSGFDYHRHFNYHLDCSDNAEMMRRMSESKVRQVKKGLINGAAIVEAKTEDEIIAYYSVLQQLYKEKVKTPLFSMDFFLSFLRLKCGKILLVKNEDKIIGGIVAPIFKGQVIYEWFVAGEDKKYKKLYPSVLATFSAMKYGCENGFSYFDFMGAGEPGKEYGVRDFKSKFGGELVEYGRFLFVCKPLLYQIGKIGVELLKKLK